MFIFKYLGVLLLRILVVFLIAIFLLLIPVFVTISIILWILGFTGEDIKKLNWYNRHT